VLVNGIAFLIAIGYYEKSPKPNQLASTVATPSYRRKQKASEGQFRQRTFNENENRRLVLEWPQVFFDERIVEGMKGTGREPAYNCEKTNLLK
jgi:hypothetical protein